MWINSLSLFAVAEITGIYHQLLANAQNSNHFGQNIGTCTFRDLTEIQIETL